MKHSLATLCVLVAVAMISWEQASAQLRVSVNSPGTEPVVAPGRAMGSTADPMGDESPKPPVAREPRGNPLWAIPLKSLTATRERPLFSPSRRPPPRPVTSFAAPPKPAEPALPPAEPPRPQLALIGVIAGEQDGVAVLLDEMTKEVVRLRKNEGHGGWILRSIKGREATLQRDAFTAVLTLPAPGAALPSAAGQPK
jgi:general secretion pathway protein N